MRRRPVLSMHPLALAVLSLLFALLARVGGAPLALLFAVVSHEAGHLCALALLGVPMRTVRISPSGVRISSPLSALSYGKEAIVSAAGAAVNLLCALIFWKCGIEALAMPSLLLGLYNLLPLSTFDGGTLLFSLLCACTPLPLHTVDAVCRCVSFLTLAFLYLFCGWFFFQFSFGGGNGESIVGGAWFLAVLGMMTEHLRTLPKASKMNNSEKFF